MTRTCLADVAGGRRRQPVRAGRRADAFPPSAEGETLLPQPDAASYHSRTRPRRSWRDPASACAERYGADGMAVPKKSQAEVAAGSPGRWRSSRAPGTASARLRRSASPPRARWWSAPTSTGTASRRPSQPSPGRPQGLAFVRDITEEDVAERLVAAANGAFGKVDILVNNVSVIAARPHLGTEGGDVGLRAAHQPALDVPVHARRRAADDGAPLGAHHQSLVGRTQGTPWQAFYSGHTPYATTKAGVEGFTRNVSMELAEFNITVNAVAPGRSRPNPRPMRMRAGPTHAPAQPAEPRARWGAARARRGDCERHPVPGLRRVQLHDGRHVD